MEPISAVENLSQDLSWLPVILEWFGELVKNLSPLIALAGAIFLYYKKADSERAEVRRDERRKVYAEYLHQCGLVWNEVTSGPVDSNIALQSANQKRYLEELRLLAPEKVYLRAFEVRSVYVDYGVHVLSLTAQQWLSKTEALRAIDNEFIRRLSVEVEELIAAMREDLQ